MGGEAADIVGVYGVAEVVRAAGLSRFGSRGAMTCHPVEYGQGEPPQQPPPPSRCPTLFGAECASAMPPRPVLPRDPSIAVQGLGHYE
ncbi:MAG: hypothetical protein AUG47_05015 [Alphaproteobacteria bacterium 13_1_20CM_3_64_12]|nr:MAG: hypothetical protein AUG47_05015 [Alphaproteobacteria bacterium 13_1_20CM_3_64_12]